MLGAAIEDLLPESGSIGAMTPFDIGPILPRPPDGAVEIVAATTRFESHPQDLCPSITQHYDGLVGLRIGRGFIKQVGPSSGARAGAPMSPP